MPRPQKKRSVHRPPLFADFKPCGVRARDLEVVPLALDELEAIRLADYEGLDHADAAEQMEISRSTFSRLVERARQKVARFLIEGQRLQVEGGEVHFQGNLIRCSACGNSFQIPFDSKLTGCPDCGSSELMDLAGGHGHGRCCGRHHRRQRR